MFNEQSDLVWLVFRISQEVEESDGVEVLIDGGVAVVPSQKVKKQKSGSKKRSGTIKKNGIDFSKIFQTATTANCHFVDTHLHFVYSHFMYYVKYLQSFCVQSF
jgi:hypothetical protein